MVRRYPGGKEEQEKIRQQKQEQRNESYTRYWWSAEEYERVDHEEKNGFYIRPAHGLRWPRDFRIYDLYEEYKKRKEMAPHACFFRIYEKNDTSRSVALYDFVRDFGLLRGHFDFNGNNQPLLSSLYNTPWSDEFDAAKNEKRMVFLVPLPSDIEPGINRCEKAYRIAVDTSTSPHAGWDYEKTIVDVNPERSLPFLQEVYAETICDGTVQRDPKDPPELTSDLAFFNMDFRDALNEDHFDWRNQLDPDTSDIKVGFGGENDSGEVYKFRSLRQAIYFFARKDIQEETLGWCIECGDFYRTETDYDRKFCPEGSRESDSPKRCQEKAHQRKNSQKDSWESFLEDHDPDLLDDWPCTDKGKLYHPHDVYHSDNFCLEDKDLNLIRAWVQRTKKYSENRDYPDPWLWDLSEDRIWRKVTQCIECGDHFQPAADSDQKFCPDSSGGSESSECCEEKAYRRKDAQRDSWERFLEERDPDLLADWPRADDGKLHHPHDVYNSDELTRVDDDLIFSKTVVESNMELIREWIKKEEKLSTDRDHPDPWLWDFAEHEGF